VSISGRIAYESGLIKLFPKDVTFQAYEMILYDKAFWISYTNTLFYTFLGTVWSMVVSLTGAYALQKSKLLFQRQFNFLLVFTMWFSPGMIAHYLNYKGMGVDNRWGIVFAFGIQAYNIILLRNYFSSIPKEIEEAAIVDGANEFQLFGKIYVPMSKASIATVTLFYAISRWNGYYWSRILLTDPYEQPLQVYLRQTIENFQKLYDESPVVLSYSADSLAYAIIICSIIPVLIIYPYITKYFAKGVNMGGVKE
jgi:putative aldouronate transport system permease protein